ncbi:MAG: hypothetical protein ThorAB25_21700, partial [Candidatus Thorarchaeota archaeon AB_25]
KHNLLGNALDNGFDNQWDDGISIGNLWDDFNPHTHSQYEILGDAGSVDRYPQTDTEYPTEIPSTSSPTTPTPTESPQQQWIVIIAVIGVVGVCLVILVIRLKR